MDEMRRSLIMTLCAAAVVPSRAALAGSSVTDLYVASAGDEMEFTPTQLSCVTGAQIRLHFQHRGKILDDPHNWVLLRHGMEQAFMADADKQPDDHSVIPPGDAGMVIAATPQCARGHEVVVRFTAPAPGDYTYVCAVAGHGESMRGILTVKAISATSSER